jgi:hypothetical protein
MKSCQRGMASFAPTPSKQEANRNFHKKIRVNGGDQEKSERMNSERTKAINPTPCGCLIG